MTPAQRLTAARLAYIGILLLATLSGLKFSPDFAMALEHLRRAFSQELRWRDAIDGIRNLVLFAGFGSVWIITATKGNLLTEVRRATIVGFFISATVEGLQCFSRVRAAAVTDIVTNTAGGFLGAFLTAEFIIKLSRSKGEKSYLGAPAFVIAGMYILAALSEALTPLFQSTEYTGISGGPLVLLRTSLAAATPLSWNEVQLTNLLLFGAAGFLSVMLVSELGRPGRAWLFVIGIVAIFGAHMAHGLFGLPIRWEVIIVDTSGFILGVIAGARWLSPLSQRLRGAIRARAMLIAYIMLLFAWAWRPFYPEWDLATIRAQFLPERFIPLASLSVRGDVFSAVHVGQVFFLFMPLGALLAVWPFRLRGRWSNLWPGVYVAVITEVGHFAMAGRTFDITNALIGIAGLCIGWIIVRRSGFVPYGEAFA